MNLMTPEERFMKFMTLLKEVETHYGVRCILYRFYWPVITYEDEYLIRAIIPEGALELKVEDLGKKNRIYTLELNDKKIWQQKEIGRKLQPPVLF